MPCFEFTLLVQAGHIARPTGATARTVNPAIELQYVRAAQAVEQCGMPKRGGGTAIGLNGLIAHGTRSHSLAIYTEFIPSPSNVPRKAKEALRYIPKKETAAKKKTNRRADAKARVRKKERERQGKGKGTRAQKNIPFQTYEKDKTNPKRYLPV
ncbi:hypothetical protein F4861DRAFT_327642 [Xylaria intraflava]|nr:hypothetical protein F4861DRAFT_327642 [Xylaria intraflava]